MTKSYLFATTLIFLLVATFLFERAAKGSSGLQVMVLPLPPTESRHPFNREVILESIARRPLSWSPVKEATLYHLQISSDLQFRRILISVYLSTDQFTIKALPRGTFFWRISSINKEGLEGKFSPVFYFVYPLPSSSGRISERR